MLHFFNYLEIITKSRFNEKKNKSGVFSDKWESRYLRFYDDVCEFLCVGHYTKNVPGKPKLPAHSNTALVFCFPRDHDRKEKEVIWLMANSMDMLNDWM